VADATIEQWAEELKAAGVTRIFGVPGGGPNLAMIGAAEANGIDFTLAHGETSACIMAAAYGATTGTVGVAIVTRGPGFTSATNGLACAQLDRLPLMLVSDTVPASHGERIAHQRLDQVAVAWPITKWSGVLGSQDPASTTQEALRIARSHPQGAVHLAFDPTQNGEQPPAVEAVAGEIGVSQEIIEQIAAAQRPVLILGSVELKDVDLPQWPILTTYHAKGVIDERADPRVHGLFTGVVADRPLLEAADLIVVLGVDTVEPMPGPWLHSDKTIAVQEPGTDTRYFNDATLHFGSVVEFASMLMRGPSELWDTSNIQTPRRNLLALTDDRFTPASIAAASVTDARITVDAGAHMLPVMQLWPVRDPRDCLISNGLATMGFALPAAIGMSLADPGCRVLCHVGDGGLSMVLGELETLARLQLPITVLVYNDSSLSLIKLKQEPAQGGSGAVDYLSIDFAQVAQAMGIPSKTITTIPQLRSDLRNEQQGPLLLDLHIDSQDYPEIMQAARG